MNAHVMNAHVMLNATKPMLAKKPRAKDTCTCTDTLYHKCRYGKESIQSIPKLIMTDDEEVEVEFSLLLLLLLLS